MFFQGEKKSQACGQNVLFRFGQLGVSNPSYVILLTELKQSKRNLMLAGIYTVAAAHLSLSCSGFSCFPVLGKECSFPCHAKLHSVILFNLKIACYCLFSFLWMQIRICFPSYSPFAYRMMM